MTAPSKSQYNKTSDNRNRNPTLPPTTVTSQEDTILIIRLRWEPTLISAGDWGGSLACSVAAISAGCDCCCCCWCCWGAGWGALDSGWGGGGTASDGEPERRRLLTGGERAGSGRAAGAGWGGAERRPEDSEPPGTAACWGKVAQGYKRAAVRAFTTSQTQNKPPEENARLSCQPAVQQTLCAETRNLMSFTGVI